MTYVRLAEVVVMSEEYIASWHDNGVGPPRTRFPGEKILHFLHCRYKLDMTFSIM